MFVNELIKPDSIAVVGASNEFSKPGGKVLANLLSAEYKGTIYCVNPKEDEIQGIKCYKTVGEMPHADIAIIAIAAKFMIETIEILARDKGTKVFIILSAGFSEVGEEGKQLEDKIVEIIDSYGGALIGPNCIGMLTAHYAGIFAGPVPKLDSRGVDFVTGSGATAVFIVEAAMKLGVTFSSLWSVGNSAQIGVEDVLQYWDETFDINFSSCVKMIYIEKVDKPDKLLKHASSLIRKGCRIAAIKSGTTEAGSRAVSSHTGALAGSDSAVDALFRKAGIVRCYSREELITVAAVFMHKELKGKRIAVITHAGGPGVMLTDALSRADMKVPHIHGTEADELLSTLFYGSSVANPIDFLATGTAEQLGIILDYTDGKFSEIDASVVIFGTPGLFDVTHVYDLLSDKMDKSLKPIFAVTPSCIQAQDSIDHFISLGKIGFPDEVVLGNALGKIYNTVPPAAEAELPIIEIEAIRNIIDNAKTGYISPGEIKALFEAAGIPQVLEMELTDKEQLELSIEKIGFPCVMKVIGPLHKTEAGGVVLNVSSAVEVNATFEKMMTIPDAQGVLIQPMISGTELFLGAKKEDKYGHLILCGLGGIFVEVLKDIQTGISPIGMTEAIGMIQSLRSYELIKGVRGKTGVDENKFAEIITRLSALLSAAPEIEEMDINPLIGIAGSIFAVDARIRIR